MDDIQSTHHLLYYIALAAPPTRCPAKGNEPALRVEVGFNPSWFISRCDIDLGERWHKDPTYRLQAWELMAAEVKKTFPGRNIGRVLEDGSPDLLTGMYGTLPIPLAFGMDSTYYSDQWPACHGDTLTDDQVDALTVPDLDNNVLFQDMLEQVETVHGLTGSTQGFMNWQGVLNTAFRLRGQDIFMDIIEDPARAHHLFDVVAETMISAHKKFYARQSEFGVDYHFGNISNCVVNMVSGDQYAEHVFPFDLKIRNEFRDFAIHNCAWNATPYLETYGKFPGLGYVDMGLETDLVKAKYSCPDARRNLLYTSMDLKNKSENEIRKDLERTALEFAPCDIGLPDIEADVPPERICYVMDLCEELSEKLPA